jgi:hypothetical protein
MDFFTVHLNGIDFIFFLFLFPRLTMLAMGTFMSHIGFCFFCGWMFFPRLTIAILATSLYWDTNPVLCVFAWLNVFRFFGLLGILAKVIK